MCEINQMLRQYIRSKGIHENALDYTYAGQREDDVEHLFGEWNNDIRTRIEEENINELETIIAQIFAWGRVGSSRLQEHYAERLRQGNTDFESVIRTPLASWSKVLAAYDPDQFFIYDSRVAVALNLLFIHFREDFVWFIPDGRSLLSQVMKKELQQRNAHDSYSRYLEMLREIEIPQERRQMERKLFMLGDYYEFRCNEWEKYIVHENE